MANSKIEERRLSRLKKEHQDKLDSGTAPFTIPKLFANVSWVDYSSDDYPKNLERKMKGMAKDKVSFYLFGDYGSGKSRLAYLYAKHLYVELGIRQVNVVRFNDIFKLVGMTYGEFKESDRFKEIKSCSHLIVDDIRRLDGKNEKQYDAFVDLLDARIESGLVTCFTSNLQPNKVAEDSGRVTSRITRILKEKKNVIVFKHSYIGGLK
jgi:DNA replication protein DnaC